LDRAGLVSLLADQYPNLIDFSPGKNNMVFSCSGFLLAEQQHPFFCTLFIEVTQFPLLIYKKKAITLK